MRVFICVPRALLNVIQTCIAASFHIANQSAFQERWSCHSWHMYMWSSRLMSPELMPLECGVKQRIISARHERSLDQKAILKKYVKKLWIFSLLIKFEILYELKPRPKGCNMLHATLLDHVATCCTNMLHPFGQGFIQRTTRMTPTPIRSWQTGAPPHVWATLDCLWLVSWGIKMSAWLFVDFLVPSFEIRTACAAKFDPEHWFVKGRLSAIILTGIQGGGLV